MADPADIITIGLCPSWDITCRGEDLRWGRHAVIERQTCRAAGKALNVSRALDWMGVASTAAGLWGQLDFAEMQADLRAWGSCITQRFTAAPGRTRHNITIIDRRQAAELHLRAPSDLAGPAVMAQLRDNLAELIRPGSLCVLAGSLPPEPMLTEAIALARWCTDRGARVVVDTSGPALRRLTAAAAPVLLKPNVAELAELAQQAVPDEPAALVAAARRMLPADGTMLISRGAAGALLVTVGQAWWGRCATDDHPVAHTVGCGDYLLAGYLAAHAAGRPPERALAAAIQAATARAWGLADEKSWPAVQAAIKVDTGALSP